MAPDRYPMRYMQNIVTRLNQKRVFTKIDLHRTFHQIPIAEEDAPKTAVTTPFSLSESIVITFGLQTAAQTIQYFMDDHIDDILVASESPKQHIEQVSNG